MGPVLHVEDVVPVPTFLYKLLEVLTCCLEKLLHALLSQTVIMGEQNDSVPPTTLVVHRGEQKIGGEMERKRESERERERKGGREKETRRNIKERRKK